MAYNQNFTRITFGGTLAGGQDIWSCNLHTVPHDPNPAYGAWQAYWETMITPLSGIIEAYVANSATLVPFDVKLTSVKVAYIDTTGHYVDAPIEIEASSSGVANQRYLPQGSVVNSLVSSKFKDPGKYNRFYLPVAVEPLGGVFKLSDDQKVAYANALKDFIQGINELLILEGSYIGEEVSVVSNSGTGYVLPVSKVRIGNIIDTQRRRRSALNENYYSVDL